ncbi:MAG: response regulator transcription factor [Planctomycetota bacterium]
MPRSATLPEADLIIPNPQTTCPAVLAVDDDPAMLSTICRVLRRSKIEVQTSTSGTEALKQLGPWLPELVLLDVSMPGLSGHMFLRRFRKSEHMIHRVTGAVLPPVPVMFLTAQGGHRQRIDGLEAGAVDYLLKPFDPDELRARVRTHLRHARRVRQAFHSAQTNLTEPSSVSGAAA